LQVIAVLDPPRNGLHPNTIRAIRACSKIDKLVYVSCKQTSFINDAAMLCRSPSKNLLGNAFVPVKATSVDMFPDTAHGELIVLLERASSGGGTNKTNNNKETAVPSMNEH